MRKYEGTGNEGGDGDSCEGVCRPASQTVLVDREREMKAAMARRVKAFVDQHGRRPQLAEISSDADWKALHDELNALRTRDGKPTHIKDEKGERVKKGSVMRIELPAPLPVVPEGIKDGRPADGEASGEAMALPAALHLCFPDLFPTMTCARRSARRGGDPRIYRVPPGDTGSSSANVKFLGEELCCRARVRAGEPLLFHYRRAPPGVDENDSAAAKNRAGRPVNAAQQGRAAAKKLKIVMEDEHMAIIVKPPSLLSVPLGARGSMDVKTLLPAFLSPSPNAATHRAAPPPPAAASTAAEELEFQLHQELQAFGIDGDAEEVLRGCGVSKAMDLLHIDDDDAIELGLGEQVLS
jgi:23S rRNA-/tRNA-specific pseudouridylate synthase